MDSNISVPFKVWLNKTDYPNSKLPARKHETDAGFDISSAEKYIIEPNETKIIHTGVHFEVLPGWEIQIRSRSGLAAKSSVFVLNSPATIDTDYTGEIMVILHNLGKNSFHVEPGDRIGQLVFSKIPPVTLELSETRPVARGRGDAGIGSSGVK